MSVNPTELAQIQRVTSHKNLLKSGLPESCMTIHKQTRNQLKALLF